MERRALLRIEAGGEASWTILDRQGNPSPVTHAPLVEAAHRIGTLPVTLITPAEATLLTEASIPARNRQQLAAALPFALEEQLADDIERLHFAPAQPAAGTGLGVAVTARARIEAWRQQTIDAGITPDSMIPETLLLPLAPGSWTLLLEEGRGVLRSGRHRGLALDPANLTPLLQLALEEAGDHPPQRIVVADYRAAPAPLPELDGATWAPRATGESPLPLFAEGYRQGDTIELLQGAYSRREQLGARLRPWLASAALLLIWLASTSISALLDHRALSSEVAENRQRIEMIYRNAFPDSTRIVDARAQMEQKLRELRGDGGDEGALTLLDRGSAALQQAEGATLQALIYREGALQLDLHTADLQQLDRLKQRLEEDGRLAAEIVSATSRDGRVEGRLRIGWRS